MDSRIRLVWEAVISTIKYYCLISNIIIVCYSFESFSHEREQMISL